MSLEQDELREAILDQLAGHTVCALATQGEDGAHAASLMYAGDGFEVYWLSDPKARHSRDLEADDRCTITVARQYEDFAAIQGLQMVGRAARITDGAAEKRAMALMAGRYPFLAKFGAGKLAQALAVAALYRFAPRRITLIDNTRSFGFKQDLEFSEGSGGNDFA
ncbi:MAG: pyridoxamine 5'-phosphate oxidase family protein [Alphaproteobacteria bacterium]|jgi:hypothetical protein|nr:pyridoxamine 5'-phosphate oxidase family protein [Alphaproteobacteria bacterium]|tara:strand:+ start:451 stop:945 length:495 start_codon:yes stop_codon:yes gene_type:complete